MECIENRNALYCQNTEVSIHLKSIVEKILNNPMFTVCPKQLKSKVIDIGFLLYQFARFPKGFSVLQNVNRQ